MNHPVYDGIAVGLGAVGGAARYRAARLKAGVFGLDRFILPRIYGSTQMKVESLARPTLKDPSVSTVTLCHGLMRVEDPRCQGRLHAVKSQALERVACFSRGWR